MKTCCYKNSILKTISDATYSMLDYPIIASEIEKVILEANISKVPRVDGLNMGSIKGASLQ